MFVEVSVLDHLILDRNHLTNKRNCMFAPLSCVLFSSSGLDRVLCPYMYWSWECPGSFQWSWQNQMSFQQLWQLTGLIVRKGKTCHFTCATRIGLTVCHLFASLESVVCMPLVWVRPPPSGINRQDSDKAARTMARSRPMVRPEKRNTTATRHTTNNILQNGPKGIRRPCRWPPPSRRYVFPQCPDDTQHVLQNCSVKSEMSRQKHAFKLHMW